MNRQSHGQFVQDKFISENDGNRITEVVVFSDQAYLKRQARIQALPGLNRFCMEISALKPDIDSVQAMILGHGEIISVQYKEIPVRNAPQEEIQKLKDKNEELIRQRKSMSDERVIIGKQTRFLDSIIEFAQSELPDKMKTDFPNAENLKKMLEFLGDNYEALSVKDRKLEYQIQDIDKDLAVMENKFSQFINPPNEMQKAAEILFESRDEHEISIEISYSAMNASWLPVYKVDVPPELSHIALTMFALINQKTGENWKHVRLSVSNSIPVKCTSLPNLETWYLSLWSSETRSSSDTSMAGVPSPMDDIDEDLIEETRFSDLSDYLDEAEFIQADETELPLAFEYTLPQRINMNSGSDETLVPLYTKKTDGEFFIYAVPQKDPLAYLVCRTSVDSEMLAGRMNIHFGGRFAGSTFLSEKKAGEDMMLNLGAERGVKIRREKIKDKRTESFFGMADRFSAAREIVYRIVVENLKEQTVRVRVIDNIPVSKTDRIQIKGIEIDPEPSEKHYYEKDGVMLWDFHLKPKSIQEIHISFFVRHPKNSPPQGL